MATLISLGAVAVSAQTHLDYWVQDLKIGLNGWTAGQPVTHGISATVKTPKASTYSSDILQALANKPVPALSQGVSNVTVVSTVAGKGQIAGTNGFAVLQGQVTLSGGKDESR